MRADMVEQAWRIVQPVLGRLGRERCGRLPIYPAGSVRTGGKRMRFWRKMAGAGGVSTATTTAISMSRTAGRHSNVRP